jgi:hypothetical protein
MFAKAAMADALGYKVNICGDHNPFKTVEYAAPTGRFIGPGETS